MRIPSDSPPPHRPPSPDSTAPSAPVSEVLGAALRELYNTSPLEAAPAAPAFAASPEPGPIEVIVPRNAPLLPDGPMPLEILRHTHPQLVEEVSRELEAKMPGTVPSLRARDIESLSNWILFHADGLVPSWPPGHRVQVRLFESYVEQGPHRFTLQQAAAWEESSPPPAQALERAQIVFPWPPPVYRS